MIASNRLLLVSRIVTAIALVALATTDPFEPGFQLEVDDVTALAFAIYSLGVALVALRSWYLDFRMSGVLVYADAAFFVALVLLSQTNHDATVASLYTLLAHIIFTSVIRWSARPMLALALFAALVGVWTVDIFTVEIGVGALDHGYAVRSLMLAMLGAGLVFWLARQIASFPPRRLRIAHAEAGLPLTAAALPYVEMMLEASQSVLCWADRHDGRVFVHTHQRARRARRGPMGGPGDTAVEADATGGEVRGEAELDLGYFDPRRDLVPMLFDLRRPHALVMRGGAIAAVPSATLRSRRLFEALGIGSGLCMPVVTAEGTDWIVLTGIPLLGWGHLDQSAAVGREVAEEVDARLLADRRRDAALARLRHAVARDLHDSVAHSLAGAKYLLMGLRSRIGGDDRAVAEIDTIRAALDAEQQNVRKLIEQLRESDPDSDARDFIADLQAIVPVLAQRWQAAIKVVESDYRVIVPTTLSIEMQQLVREAVSNSARHGAATAIEIACRVRAGWIELSVTDNGTGLAEPDLDQPRSLSERVAELGGEIAMQSRPGRMQITMRFPRVPIQGNIS